jgi:hypothetical protein
VSHPFTPQHAQQRIALLVQGSAALLAAAGELGIMPT